MTREGDVVPPEEEVSRREAEVATGEDSVRVVQADTTCRRAPSTSPLLSTSSRPPTLLGAFVMSSARIYHPLEIPTGSFCP